jgi:hypothetical protein
MKKNRYDIDFEFMLMLFSYKNYLRTSSDFLINKNIALHITETGVLKLFIKEKNKEKGITIFDYKFIK